MNTLVCPHCHTQVPKTASVCTGCGAEVIRGLSRGARSLVGFGFVIFAVLLATIALRALEIAEGKAPLPPPKPEHGPYVIAVLVILIVIPYIIGSRVARLLWPSRIRFYRHYQHR